MSGQERAGAELGQQWPVQTALVEQVDAAQIRVRITQPRPSDPPGDLGVRAGGAGVLDDQPDAFFERQADRECLVRGVDRLEQLARSSRGASVWSLRPGGSTGPSGAIGGGSHSGCRRSLKSSPFALELAERYWSTFRGALALVILSCYAMDMASPA